MIDITSKGKVVLMPLNKFGDKVAKFEVKILDTKYAYGKLRFLVTPVCGGGEFWIEARNLEKK